MERTPLHSACEDDSSAVVLEVIMRLVTSEQTRYKLLQLTDMRGFTPLHNAAEYNATQAIQIIADFKSSHHLMHLLTIKGWFGLTPVQLAAISGKQEAVKILHDYRSTALIDIALQQTDYTGAANMEANNNVIC